MYSCWQPQNSFQEDIGRAVHLLEKGNKKLSFCPQIFTALLDPGIPQESATYIEQKFIPSPASRNKRGPWSLFIVSVKQLQISHFSLSSALHIFCFNTFISSVHMNLYQWKTHQEKDGKSIKTAVTPYTGKLVFSSSSHLQTDTLFCVGKYCKKEMPKSSKGPCNVHSESSVFVNGSYSFLG